MWADRESTTRRGTNTVRRPASVLGSLTRCRPPSRVTICPETVTVAASRLMWRRRRPSSSPRRSPANPARRMSDRHLGPMASASCRTVSGPTIGRSGERSIPAPRTLHGFFWMSPSSTAVVRTARRSRQDLAAMIGLERVDTSAYQRRIASVRCCCLTKRSR